MTTLTLVRISSPLGPMRAVTKQGRLCALEFDTIWPEQRRRLLRRFGEPRFEQAPDAGGIADTLRAYFDGDLKALDSVAVDLGGTAFQRDVWFALRHIPAGATCTYAELARRLGRPRAFRAVGAANGQNPIAIVIPCHRLVGSNGALTGYASGVANKRWLLEHEGARPATT